ncbi:[protein-PII] uridylyltransferase [Alteromonas lipolytica]|uniref:Bifunctional uridylyltransferase/uridylyl-removing enzyme n=1 Tax=Alteromonas lipolytica TaxID=1856405 RepID=A0A1E8FE48_9ALTE|nr:[protein-PII] uridylyltransferase [Alteromonas lipolytica]OFI34227.1 [protein-PII] uridylyltransferase [Alteromonas lipolytica]GGF83972.1 bifunctional uridylyltransferase/uridylyl-removing enzyme [Alteromonas lipolytica]
MKLKSLCEEVANITAVDDIKSIKALVARSYEWLETSFTLQPIDELVTGRAVFIDTLLQRLWSLYDLANIKGLALCAVGGYGRGHLQPYSDIDLLIVSKKALKRDVQEKVGQFITLLWDIKLDVGQSVRTIKETVKLAKDDISIATNLVESRMLSGCDQTFVEMWHAVNGKDTCWTSKAFFTAKYEEQKARHAKFNGTSYNLEPNIKENPGCLRDIQSIGWVAKKHFKEYDGKGLVGHGYFTKDELDELVECRMALWRIRFALHLVAGRSENRLLFDYQPEVAAMLGYGEDSKTAVEKMMRAFFRTVRRISELNQMLLQRFRYDMLNQTIQSRRAINDSFCLLDGNISPTHNNVFESPEDILSFLKLIADTRDVQGLDTNCIRQLRNARRRFQAAYYVERAECRRLIMELFKHPHFFDFAWNIMHQYGILQSYLPEWDHIVGMMQFDLFHAYTVDEHTHRLVKHVNHYFQPDNTDFPRCGRIVRNFDKPELIYIAAIFHDIAKGRNGDHSTLGAKDVAIFCEAHDIHKSDAELIAWLVENHLLMSVVAQRRDIYDPDVVNDFATAVRSHTHLNLLYILTLADIRATNDNLWNDWKASLLKELYSMTQKALDNGLQCGVTMRDRVDSHKSKALELLATTALDAERIETLWSRFEDDYFARFKPEQISWHTQEILAFENQHEPGEMLIKTNNDLAKGGTELLLYGDDRPALFAQIASVLDSRNCSIHDAHIAVTRDDHVFDSILILENDGSRIEGESRLRSIEKAIAEQLLKPGRQHNNTRKLSRQHKHLDVPVKVRFYSSQDDATLIELEALDAPGILAKVGHAFVDCNLTLKLAKIATIGERAEDVFIVSNEHGKALTQEEQTTLKKRILFKLDQLEDINIP